MKWIKNLFFKNFLSKLAKDSDTATTLLGLIASALLAANINWDQVMTGDGSEAGKVAGIVVVAAWGWFTNRKAPPQP